jgi:hypothetical protein
MSRVIREGEATLGGGGGGMSRVIRDPAAPYRDRTVGLAGTGRPVAGFRRTGGFGLAAV